MILLLLEHLRESWGMHIPQAFDYVSTRMMLAAITTLVLSIFLGPRFITLLYELKIGQSIRQEDCPLLGELHRDKKNTPTMGGVLILASLLVSLLLWMDPRSVFTLVLFVTTVLLGLLGGVDDYLKLRYQNTAGLSAKGKLAIQCLLGAFLAGYLLIPQWTETLHQGRWYSPPVVKEFIADKDEGHKTQQLTVQEYAARLYIPFVKQPLIFVSGSMMLLFGIFVVMVVTGASNAVNLTDGLDGLAAGCIILVALSLALLAFLSNNSDFARYLNILYIEGSGEVAIYLSALVGACLGFLWYNSYPAQVFMGDTGSLAMGGILGVTAVLLKRELLLAIIGGIFAAEALSVILQVGSYKLRNRRRVFLCAPLHHHFEYKGWPETKVVIRFWIIGFLLATFGLLSLKIQ